MNKFALQEIPTVGEVTEPPSLNRPQTFDRDAEAYLRSQHQLFLGVNKMVSVLNPVVTEVMTQAQSVEAHSSQVRSYMASIQKEAESVHIYHQEAIEEMAAIEQLSQKLEQVQNEINTARDLVTEESDSALTNMTNLLEQCQQTLVENIQQSYESANSLNEVIDLHQQVSALLEKVEQAQQQALVITTEQLPDALVGQIETERRRTRLQRILHNQI